MRDLRDPQALGERIITLSSKHGLDFTEAMDEVICDSGVPWTGDGLMSNNPAEHHSKTPQGVGTKIGSPSSQGFSE